MATIRVLQSLFMNQSANQLNISWIHVVSLLVQPFSAVLKKIDSVI